MANQKVETGKILVVETRMFKRVEYLIPAIFKWETLERSIQSSTVKNNLISLHVFLL